MPFSPLICYVFLLSLSLAILPAGKPAARHPLHVSTTEIGVNAKEKSLEVMVRLFTDDFESILAKKYRSKTDLSSPVLHKQMDVLVSKYITENLRIKAEGKTLTLQYVGFETDHEAVIAYFEVPGLSGLKKLESQNTLLYDLFDDQLNIMHVISGGTRKSGKLLFPEKLLITTF